MKKLYLIVAAAAIAASGFTVAVASRSSERQAKELAAYEPVGAPVNCIALHSIRDTNVIDDRTIDFKVGSKMYRNTLPHSCPSLGSEERFSYHTSVSQLCSIDIIRVLHDYGGSLQEGAGCGLGKFQPMVKAAPAQ